MKAEKIMKDAAKPKGNLIPPSGQGRIYHCGTMTAIFKADEEETTRNTVFPNVA